MDQIAFFFREYYIYWSSVLLMVAVCVAIFLFLSLYLGRGGKMAAAFGVVPLAVLVSLICARLIHWYCFAESYSGFTTAMTDYSQGGFALVGAFAGCALAVGVLTVVKTVPDPLRMLDCMCLAGGGGIAIGRLASFFSTADRGQILESIRSLPLASAVINVVSKATEYRLATFMLQAMVALALFIILSIFYLKGKDKVKDGDTCLIFLLVYCASQVVLDSTRYDSLFFRSNGFVSIVQVFSALGLGLVIAVFSKRLVKVTGFKIWYVFWWILIGGCIGGGGFMEYYVQRHGDQPVFAYSVMSAFLAVIVLLTLLLRFVAVRAERKMEIA